MQEGREVHSAAERDAQSLPPPVLRGAGLGMHMQPKGEQRNVSANFQNCNTAESGAESTEVLPTK